MGNIPYSEQDCLKCKLTRGRIISKEDQCPHKCPHRGAIPTNNEEICSDISLHCSLTEDSTLQEISESIERLYGFSREYHLYMIELNHLQEFEPKKKVLPNWKLNELKVKRKSLILSLQLEINLLEEGLLSVSTERLEEMEAGHRRSLGGFGSDT